jgi:hypothetical protein
MATADAVRNAAIAMMRIRAAVSTGAGSVKWLRSHASPAIDSAAERNVFTRYSARTPANASPVATPRRLSCHARVGSPRNGPVNVSVWTAWPDRCVQTSDRERDGREEHRLCERRRARELVRAVNREQRQIAPADAPETFQDVRDAQPKGQVDEQREAEDKEESAHDLCMVA